MAETIPDEKAIFDAALLIPSLAERHSFVAKACGGDVRLLERVEALLRIHESDQGFLEAPAAVVPAPPAELASECLGAVINNYQLLEQLGEGGMGAVFLAEQLQPIRRQVALKVIKPGMDSRQVMARFEAERQALAVMDHTNIARVFDAGQCLPGTAVGLSGRPYFVMELVRGQSITHYCDERRLTPHQRLELFIPVCNAVQHAHQKGIIHRDIKPSNILVQDNDGRPVPKIIDFGVAKAVGMTLADHTFHTGPGDVVGTLEYMSPEQAGQKQDDVDTRSDVYSLGVLLYELLTGTRPFERKQFHEAALAELLRVIREEEPPKPSTRLSTAEQLPSIAACRAVEPKKLSALISGDLDWIVMKSLDKDRARRYATANGLARDIERFLHEEPVEACPPSAAYRLRKFARRHKAGLATATAFLVLLVAGALVSIGQAYRATMAERTARDNELKAIAQMKRADDEAAIAKAVNEFLQHDLLSQADISNQPSTAPRNRNITVRELLDRASEGIEAKFVGQELTEAAIHHTLGLAYQGLGELPEAQEHLKQVVELRQRKLGAADVGTLRALANLAVICDRRGLTHDAVPLYQQALEGMTAILGADHPDTLRNMANLTWLEARGGSTAGAVPKLLRVIDGFRQAYGDDHKTTILWQGNLAALYVATGDFSKAEQLLLQAVETLTAKNGPDHPLAMMVMNNLGRCYLQAKRYPDAEATLVRVRELQQARLGPDHPETLTTTHDLAWVYKESKQLAKAAPLFEEGLKLSRVKPGPTHPDTLRFMNGMAMTLSKQNRQDEAEAMFKQVLEIRRAALGPDHRDTLVSINNLAAHYQLYEQYDKAAPLFVEAAEGALRRMGINTRETKDYIRNCVQVYTQLGKPIEAESWRKRLPPAGP